MLPVLTVSGPEGFVYLNGQFAGLSGHSALPLSRNGTHYLQFYPLGASLCFALCLTLEGGTLTHLHPQNACAVQWPSGWIALELPENPDPSPRLLASWEQYLLVEEDGAVSFGKNETDALSLPLSHVQQPQFSPAPFGVLLQGLCSQGQFRAMFSFSPSLRSLGCMVGDEISLLPDGRILCVQTCNDFRRHVSRQIYQADASGIYLLETAQTLPASDAPAPASFQEYILCFLESLHLHCLQEAAEYLEDPSRLDEISQTIGVFDLIVPLPQGTDHQSGVLRRISPSLAHVFSRTFEEDSRSGKIREVKVSP